MPKFQIGDIIVGNTSNEYGFTDDRAICEVVDFYKGRVDDISVRIIYREGYSGNAVFSVESKYFDLVIPAKERPSVKEMTVAEISEKLGYEVKIVK